MGFLKKKKDMKKSPEERVEHAKKVVQNRLTELFTQLQPFLKDIRKKIKKEGFLKIDAKYRADIVNTISAVITESKGTTTPDIEDGIAAIGYFLDKKEKGLITGFITEIVEEEITELKTSFNELNETYQALEGNSVAIKNKIALLEMQLESTKENIANIQAATALYNIWLKSGYTILQEKARVLFELAGIEISNEALTNIIDEIIVQTQAANASQDLLDKRREREQKITQRGIKKKEISLEGEKTFEKKTYSNYELDD